jgi:hypothetical protein
VIDITGIGRLQRKAQSHPAESPTPKPENVLLDGFTRFHIGVNVSIDEMRHWSPQKMTDFFQGVAKVVHAADDRNWQRRD